MTVTACSMSTIRSFLPACRCRHSRRQIPRVSRFCARFSLYIHRRRCRLPHLHHNFAFYRDGNHHRGGRRYPKCRGHSDHERQPGVWRAVPHHSGDPLRTTLRSAFLFDGPFTVTVTDASGNLLPGIAVTFTVPSTGCQRFVQQRSDFNHGPDRCERQCLRYPHGQSDGRAI